MSNGIVRKKKRYPSNVKKQLLQPHNGVRQRLIKKIPCAETRIKMFQRRMTTRVLKKNWYDHLP